MNVGIASAVCLALFWVLRIHPKSQLIVVGLIISLAYAAWFQSQILAWDFGPLDGRGIKWDQWLVHGMIELAIWLAILTFGTVATIRNPGFVSTASHAIIILGILTTSVSYFTSDYTPKEERPEGYDSLFRFHPENNTILILLDCFQIDLFTEIEQKYPEDLEFLDGFTFYRNHLTGYPTTYTNIPLMFTGRFYDNEEPVREFVKNAYAESSVTKTFAEAGYTTDVAPVNDLMVEGLDVGSGVKAPTYRIVEQSSDSLIMPAMLVTDGGLFRAAPTFLKDNVYGEGDWFISAMLTGPDIPLGWHGTDVRFLRLFERESNTETTQNGSFKYLHFETPHPPYRVNKDLEPVPEGEDTRDKVIGQARGGLTIARRVLARLRKLGIYDSSEIIITSDHGTGTHPVEFKNETIDSATPAKGIPWYVRSSGIALFLYKPKDTQGPLRTSDVPTHMSDLHCFLTRPLIETDDCEQTFDQIGNPGRVRQFYHYHWTKEYGDWSKDRLPPIQKYEVIGHSLDPASWRKANTGLEPEPSIQEEPLEILELGRTVVFSSDESSGPYLGKGWSFAEPNHRWTDGSIAELKIRLPYAVSHDLVFRFDASAFAIKGIVDFQEIKVRANGTVIGEWLLKERKWHEIRIPTAIITDEELTIELLISDPTAPRDIADSNDARKLGIRARQFEIVLDEERID